MTEPATAAHGFTPDDCPLGEHLTGMRYDADRDLFVCPLCGWEASTDMGGI